MSKKKIKIKDANGAARELLRALRMQLKAKLLLGQGDWKNGVEVYHASADHTVAAMEFILSCPDNHEIRSMLSIVTISGVLLEEEFNLRKEV